MTSREVSILTASLKQAEHALAAQPKTPSLEDLARRTAELAERVQELYPQIDGGEPMEPPARSAARQDPFAALQSAVERALEMLDRPSHRNSAKAAEVRAGLEGLRADLVELLTQVARPDGESAAVSGAARAEETRTHPSLHADHAVAPKTGNRDWPETKNNEHFVQFYEEEAGLLQTLTDYVADGLWRGERVLAIATPKHRGLLEARLRKQGIDVPSALVTRQYIACDAAEMLRRFMVDGLPDATAFDATVGALVRRSLEGGRALRGFGEMVALLWLEGNRAGALRLEELWNRLAQDRPFSLFCAYPAHSFSVDESDTGARADVCRCHSRVISAENSAGQKRCAGVAR